MLIVINVLMLSMLFLGLSFVAVRDEIIVVLVLSMLFLGLSWVAEELIVILQEFVVVVIVFFVFSFVILGRLLCSLRRQLQFEVIATWTIFQRDDQVTHTHKQFRCIVLCLALRCQGLG